MTVALLAPIVDSPAISLGCANEAGCHTLCVMSLKLIKRCQGELHLTVLTVANLMCIVALLQKHGQLLSCCQAVVKGAKSQSANAEIVLTTAKRCFPMGSHEMIGLSLASVPSGYLQVRPYMIG